MFKAILWDMDGTLVDSEPLWAITTYELSDKLGRRITEDVHAQTVGGTFENTLRICAEYAGVAVSPERAEILRREMLDRIAELFTERLELVPGIAPLLDELSTHGVPMMIVTNTPREVADPAIAAIGADRFVSTICGDEVTNGKPDPEIYLTAAQRVGAKPSECLVFEDSGAGMAAATAAGCVVIGLPHDSSVTVPAGVTTLESLRGSTSFLGVTMADLTSWYELSGRVRG